MNSNVEVKISLIEGDEDLGIPAYQTPGSSGVDLRASVSETIYLNAGDTTLIPTGLKIELPLGYEGQVRPRSGLAIKYGITVLNSPGTIDSDYRGEIKVPLINLGHKTVEITRGMRIAQLVIAPVVMVSFNEVSDLSQTNRNSGGFGHTGE